MQTSTPSAESRRRTSKNSSILDISPVSKGDNEASSKVYSRRERKPRKWDNFEVDSPSEQKRNEKETSALAKESSIGWLNTDICDKDVDSGAVLLDQDKCISVTETSLVGKESENAGRKSKGRAKIHRKTISDLYKSSEKIKSSGNTEIQCTEDVPQPPVENGKLSGKKQSLTNNRKVDVNISHDFPEDNTGNLDERLTPDNEEVKILRDAVEGKRTSKYIEKKDRVMDKDSCPIENKVTTIKKTPGRKRGRAKKSVVEDISTPTESSVQVSGKSISNECLIEGSGLDKDDSIDISNSYKTPVRKRGRPKKKDEDKLESPEDSLRSNSASRRRVKASDKLDLETNITEETVNVSLGSKRKGRKRKTINYADLDSGDLEKETTVEEVKKTAKLKHNSNEKNEEARNDDDTQSEKVPKSKRSPKKEPVFKCHHCDYEGKGVQDIRKHNAVAHQLWWTEECQEGSSDRSALTKIIKIKKFLNCTKCGKQINFVTYYPNHIEWCGRENLTYVCEYCQKGNLVLRWQNLHLKTCPALVAQAAEERRKEKELQEDDVEEETAGRGRKRKAAKKAMSMVHNISKEMGPSAESDISDDDDDDPDAEIPEEEENDDEEDVDDDEINEDSSIGTPDENEEEDIVDFDNDDGSTLGSFRKLNTFMYFNPLPLVNDFVKENWSTNVFPEWLPWKQDWQLLSQQDSEPYLPKQSTSMKFSFGKVKRPSTLEMLESTIIAGSPLFYTGLNIWKLAWCPTNLQCTDDQYLAVTGKLSHSQSFLTNKRYEGRSLIQVWNTGIKSNKTDTKTLPKLSYNIVQDYGLATQMVWCPSGCYKTNQDQEDKAHLRLGLLAVSYTDGSCRIYSIPLLPPVEDGPAPTYKAKPIVTLVPYQSYKDHDITCSCVDWVKASGHTKVITGYSNGSVRLFNLACKSPLQYLKTSEGIKLLPFINLQPHGNLVRAVSFCSNLENYFATSSEDFETCFWDINSLGSPLHVDGGFYMTMCMCNSVLQHGVYVGCDDNYTYLTNKGRYIESGHLMYCGKPEHRKEERGPYYTSSQPACVWDVDCSEWTGFVVACDNRGYISGLLLRDLMKVTPDCKSYKYRQILLKTKVIENEDGNEEENTNTQNKPEKTLNSETTNGVSETANGVGETANGVGETTNSQAEPCVKDENKADKSWTCDGEAECPVLEKYNQDYFNRVRTSVLHFEEHHVTAKFCPQDTESDVYNRPSVAAIKSLHCNPNQQQCCWLAYGGNSGLVRIINLQKMLGSSTQTYMKLNNLI